MSFVDTLESIATGALTGVAVITALPVFGAVGTALGAAAAIADSLSDDD